MRAYEPAYEMTKARDLDHALELLASGSGLRPFAGGTDLMVLLEAGHLPEGRYLDIWGLDELRGIRVTGEYVDIGALTTYTDIRGHDVIRAEYPLLVQAARETGAIAIQNRGTIGGNIANASPAADSPPALLAYGAEVEIVSSGGNRRIPYEEFHLDYKKMRLDSGELIRSVRVPRRNDSGAIHYYYKVGTRRAQAISKICFAGYREMDGDRVGEVRIGLGSVAPVPLRCVKTEALLRGNVLDDGRIARAREALGAEISPIADIRSDEPYRREVTLNLLEDFLRSERSHVGLDH